MKAYKLKYQHVYMSEDIKPKGKWKRAIEGSVRMSAKKELRQELDNSIEYRDKNCRNTRTKKG